MTTKYMTSKFDSKCTGCRKPIKKGEEIAYIKGRGAWHKSCSPAPADTRAEDGACSDLGYEDACAAACGL